MCMSVKAFSKNTTRRPAGNEKSLYLFSLMFDSCPKVNAECLKPIKIELN